MKRLLLPVLLLVGPLLAGCDDDTLFPDRVKGEGPVVSESRSATAFSGVRLALDADVYLTQGPTQSIRVEAQQNVLDVLKTDVRDNQLSIRFENRTNVRRYDPIRLYITLPTLADVDVSGSGRVAGQGPWSVQDLDLDVSGSGRIELAELTARDLHTVVSGSGAVQLDGTARQHRVVLSGSGQVQGFGLTQNTADVNITGSGSSRLSVTQELNAAISGSGMVYYRGQPTVTSRITGSGRVVNSS